MKSAKLRKRQNYTVFNTFDLDEVLPFLICPYERYPKEQTRRNYPDRDGHMHSVNMQSYRLWTFLTCGTACVSCGKRGSFFSLERDRGNKNGPPHLNLYAINDSGEWVLMTKDHIIPRSKEGGDTQSNLQTMCSTCNYLKGAD